MNKVTANHPVFPETAPNLIVTSGHAFGILAAMEPAPRQTFEPAGAGALLAGATAAGVGVGAAIGWGVGSWAIGALVGAVAGIPAGVFAVYRRYRNFFT